MAKQGMRRYKPSDNLESESSQELHYKKKNVPDVPEIQGKAKSGKVKADPIKK